MNGLFEQVNSWGHPRILVVGDLMLDRYTWGDTERVSPEAPVLVLRAETEEIRLGGAASVAALLRGLEAEVSLAGVIGPDANGRLLRALLQEDAIDDRLVFCEPDRRMTTKDRFLGRSASCTTQQVLRVDYEHRHCIRAQMEERLLVGTTVYAYSGYRRLCDYIVGPGGESTLGATYIWGHYLDELVAISAGGENLYCHCDDIYSVVAISNTQQQVVSSYAYAPYGARELVAGSDLLPSVGFTGQWLDAEIGLYHYKSRDYSPDLGRFVQRDPIGYDDGDNLYQYVHSSPLGLLDPYGMTSEPSLSDCDTRAFRLELASGKGGGPIAALEKAIQNITGTKWELDVKIYGSYKECRKFCCIKPDGTRVWAPYKQFVLGGRIEGKATAFVKDLYFVSIEGGIYMRAGGAGEISATVDYCDMTVQGGGCFTVYGEVGIEGIGRLRTPYCEAEAGIRGGVRISVPLCLSCNMSGERWDRCACPQKTAKGHASCQPSVRICIQGQIRLWAKFRFRNRRPWDVHRTESISFCTGNLVPGGSDGGHEVGDSP